TIGDRGGDLARFGIEYHRRLAAPGEDPVRGAIVGDAGRAFARRQRPRRDRRHRLLVDHLDGALAFVVDEDLSLAVAGRAFGRIILELHRGDEISALGIDGDDGAGGTAVVRENDADGEVVIHDAVEPAGRNLDLLD